MGVQIPTTISFNLPDGTEVIIETGKLAAQAHGSVVVRIGKTMMFASVCSAHAPREGRPWHQGSCNSNAARVRCNVSLGLNP